MNASTLSRGLAALCLLCVLPKLGATVLTITQTANVSNGNSGQNTVGASAFFNFAPFDSALGVLESVTFQATAFVTVSAMNAHYYGIMPGPPYTPPPAMDFTPYTALHVDIDPGFSSPETRASDYSYGEQTLVQPFQVFSHTHLHVITLSHTERDAVALARYLGPSFALRAVNTVGEGYGRYGGMGVNGSVQASLTYNYRVPEAGATLAMLGSAILLLFAFRKCVQGIARVPTLS